jgi:predicted nucleic acid-binding protein
MTEGYLLDTNILIYFTEGNLKLIAFLSKLKQETFFASVISHFEFLDGHKTSKQLNEMEKAIEGFIFLDLRREITKAAAELDLKTKKKLKLKDLLIAATAKVENLTIVTADKDFKKVEGVETLQFKL